MGYMSSVASITESWDDEGVENFNGKFEIAIEVATVEYLRFKVKKKS